MKTKITLPKQVLKIIDILEQNGFEAYAVGGCVRDSILLKKPDDWDICTSALPEQIKKCFKEYPVIETGIQHGTVTVLQCHIPFEVTTFRTDGKYSDSRHPDRVKFVCTLQEDLSRRDFTINAMAYNPQNGLVDCFGGQNDLTSGLIRCVGDPKIRFQEDALRILRALRFASAYGFHLESATAYTVHNYKELLKNISFERIRIEFCKLLCGKDAAKILESFSDVFCVFIPEIKPIIGFHQNHPMHCFDVWHHTLQSISSIPEDLTLRLTMLFHDIAKPLCKTTEKNGKDHFYGHPKKSAEIAEIIMKRLKFDNDTLTNVKNLILYHHIYLPPENRLVKRWLNKVGEKKLRQIIQIKRADIMAQTPKYKKERLVRLDKTESLINNTLKEQQCFCLKQLAVNGCDLIDIGIHEGKLIGNILNKLVELVIDNKLLNQKEILLKTAKEIVHKNEM